MGNRIPSPVNVPPVEEGDPSTTCWGPGKDFGDKGTPEQIIIRVSGVTKGPGWMAGDGETQNGEYLLEQRPALPNIFQDLPAPVIAEIRFTPLETFCRIFSTTGQIFFGLSVPELCQTFFENEVVDKFQGGTVRVWLLGVQV